MRQHIALTNFANLIMLPASMLKTGIVLTLFAGSALAQTPSATNAPSSGNASAATNAPSAAAIVGGANTASNPTRQIGLAEALQMALQSNLDIQVSRFDPMISGYSVTAATAVYEP